MGKKLVEAAIALTLINPTEVISGVAQTSVSLVQEAVSAVAPVVQEAVGGVVRFPGDDLLATAGTVSPTTSKDKSVADGTPKQDPKDSRSRLPTHINTPNVPDAFTPGVSRTRGQYPTDRGRGVNHQVANNTKPFAGPNGKRGKK